MTINVDINLLETNKGQITGLPANPRLIKDERYNQLMKSIQDDPEMLDLREVLVYPLEDRYVIIGGNMRYRVCKELGYKEIPCKIIPKETPIKKLAAIAVKDNVSFGEWDMDLLENDWELDDLIDYGMELDGIEKDVEDVDDFNRRFNKITDENCIYPIVPEFDEKCECFIIVSRSEIDSNWLRERLGMQKMQSYKNSTVSKSNIISIEDLKDVL